MIRYCTSILCVLLLVFTPAISVAQTPDIDGRVTSVKEGDPAPFDGTLFDTNSSAKLLTDLRLGKEICDAEKSKELGLLQSKLTLQIDTLRAECDALKIQHEKILEIKNEQIEYLQDLSVAPKWYESDAMWFSLGVLGGILLTISSAYAIGQVAK